MEGGGGKLGVECIHVEPNKQPYTPASSIACDVRCPASMSGMKAYELALKNPPTTNCGHGRQRGSTVCECSCTKMAVASHAKMTIPFQLSSFKSHNSPPQKDMIHTIVSAKETNHRAMRIQNTTRAHAYTHITPLPHLPLSRCGLKESEISGSDFEIPS